MLTKTRRAILATACFLSLLAVPSSKGAVVQAPDFSLRSIDGPAVTSQTLRGEVVVLAFGASWLPLSRNQMDGVKKLADQYAGKGLAVYWVSADSETVKSKNSFTDGHSGELPRKYKFTSSSDPNAGAAKSL